MCTVKNVPDVHCQKCARCALSKMCQMCTVKNQTLAVVVKKIYFKVNKEIFICFGVNHPLHLQFQLDRPFHLPVPRPMVKYSVRTFCAKTLSTKHAPARKDPAMVTARQPYLFTNELEIGPEIQKQTHDTILEKGKTLPYHLPFTLFI